MSFITDNREAAFDNASSRSLEEVTDTAVMQLEGQESYIVVTLSDFNSGNYPEGYQMIGSGAVVISGTVSELKFHATA